MAIVYGDFESMALHFLRELPKKRKGNLVFFHDMTRDTYGVCDAPELAELVDAKKIGKVRPVCCMTAGEFTGLLFARYLDFFPGVDDAVN